MDEILKLQLLRTLETEYKGDKKMFLAAVEEIINKKVDITSKPKVVKDGKVVIKLNNVSKRYKVGGDYIEAVKKCNFEIYEGEMIAIMGTSGSGKSTLLNLIGGLDKPTEGEILIEEKNISKMSDKTVSNFRCRTLGFVFQFFYLQPYLNVRENIEIPMIFNKSDIKLRKENALNALNLVGLLDKEKVLPKQLSGGQLQRVAIARALVNNPKILLTDEPTGNLDRKTGLEIIKLLKELNTKQGTTIVMVTHNEEIASYADRTVKMIDGELFY